MEVLNESAPIFRVGILLIDGFALMSYSATVEPLRAANQLAGKTLYNIRHLPVSGASAMSSSGISVKAQAHFGEQIDFDLVLVVAGGDPLSFRNERVFQWLRHLSRRGIYLGGVSGGPAILATAGVMDGYRMTVHWEHAAALSEVLPSLIVEQSLYIMDRQRITCAGGTAPLDMMHALITAHHGSAFARQVSDWYMHTEIRQSGEPQRAGLVERYDTTNPAIISTIEVMENHIADPLTLQQLAELAGMGTRQLNRLFQDKMQQSTMAFYRERRLDKSRQLLTQSTLSVTQIALAAGFAGSAHFSSAFRSRYGLAPSAMRR